MARKNIDKKKIDLNKVKVRINLPTKINNFHLTILGKSKLNSPWQIILLMRGFIIFPNWKIGSRAPFMWNRVWRSLILTILRPNYKLTGRLLSQSNNNITCLRANLTLKLSQNQNLGSILTLIRNINNFNHLKYMNLSKTVSKRWTDPNKTYWSMKCGNREKEEIQN